MVSDSLSLGYRRQTSPVSILENSLVAIFSAIASKHCIEVAYKGRETKIEHRSELMLKARGFHPELVILQCARVQPTSGYSPVSSTANCFPFDGIATNIAYRDCKAHPRNESQHANESLRIPVEESPPSNPFNEDRTNRCHICQHKAGPSSTRSV